MKQSINAEQLSLFESVNNRKAKEYDEFNDQFSSQPVDLNKIWAEKFALNDEEIDRILAPGNDDDKPLPPSLDPYEGKTSQNIDF